MFGGFKCTRGSRSGSKCDLICFPGYQDAGIKLGKKSSRICSCLNEACIWEGEEFSCEGFHSNNLIKKC